MCLRVKAATSKLLFRNHSKRLDWSFNRHEKGRWLQCEYCNQQQKLHSFDVAAIANTEYGDTGPKIHQNGAN